MPMPDGLLPLLEDFTSVFDAEASHIRPLRNWLSYMTSADLRQPLPESLLKLKLTTTGSTV